MVVFAMMKRSYFVWLYIYIRSGEFLTSFSASPAAEIGNSSYPRCLRIYYIPVFVLHCSQRGHVHTVSNGCCWKCGGILFPYMHFVSFEA